MAYNVLALQTVWNYISVIFRIFQISQIQRNYSIKTNFQIACSECCAQFFILYIIFESIVKLYLYCVPQSRNNLCHYLLLFRR